MSKCGICNSEHCAAIDSQLDSGVFQRDIALLHGVSRHAISRHVRHSKTATTAAPENGDGESLEAQAEKWLRRADDIYATSTANQDARGQVQALTAAFRGLELQHKSEKAAEDAPPADGVEPVTIAMIDALVQSELAKSPRGRNQNRLYSAPDKVLELAARLADNPASWATVESILESTQVN